MSQLWIPDRSGAWGVFPLAARSHDLATLPPRLVPAGADCGPAASRVWLVPTGAAFALVAGARRDVAVNGTPLVLGFAVLADRDDIVIGGVGRAYWSAERPARAVPFAGGEGTNCPRCGLRASIL